MTSFGQEDFPLFNLIYSPLVQKKRVRQLSSKSPRSQSPRWRLPPDNGRPRLFTMRRWIPAMWALGAKGMEFPKHWDVKGRAFTRKAANGVNGRSCQILLLLLRLLASATPLFSAPRIPSLRKIDVIFTLTTSEVLDQPSEPDIKATRRHD